jgi:hypothetical protein
VVIPDNYGIVEENGNTNEILNRISLLDIHGIEFLEEFNEFLIPQRHVVPLCNLNYLEVPMVGKVLFQGRVKRGQAQKLLRVETNREGDVELGEKRDKKRVTIANTVFDCHGRYKESMSGTYRRPKLERVRIPVSVQSREHPKSLNTTKE